MPHNQQVKLVVSLLDSPIAFNRTFAKITGNSLTAGMLLSQLFYWAKTMKFEEFYKTNEDLQEECFLSRRDFDSARKILVELDVIQITKKGLPAKQYYSINLAKLLELINNICTNKDVHPVQPRMYDTSTTECTERTNTSVQGVHSIINNKDYTENTTENITPNPLEGANGHPSNLIVDEILPTIKKQHSQTAKDMAVDLWLSIIDDKIKNKKWAGFTSFELDAIKYRAMSFPNMQPMEVENELIQIDKWAWEGLEIEDALRCGYRKIQSFRASMRKRIKQDSQGNAILNIDILNNMRLNEIRQQSSQKGK